MKKENFGQRDSLIDFLIDGNSITRLEALLLFGVQNLTAIISILKQEGYLVKRKNIFFIKALIRINKKFKVEVPNNLPTKEIVVSEYWISQ